MLNDGNSISLKLEGNIIQSLVIPMRSLILWKHNKEMDIRKPLSESLEKEAINKSIYFIEETLGNYKTSIEEDQVLQQQEKDVIMRNILTLRISEKKTLKKRTKSITGMATKMS